EYACRGGQSQPYAWTPKRAASDDSGETAGIAPALPITPVGSYRPNRFGLYDMRGNAWEWCGDWFDRAYYRRSPKRDPQGPAKGYLKVVRGGDWVFVGEVCRINYPIMSPWQRSPFVGFRVVCEIADSAL
ncbi:MAG: formylglycine-generating enzyme family protein, partial [Candidatus Saccharimonadales bacterium]